MPITPEDDLDKLSHAAQAGLERNRQKAERRSGRTSSWPQVKTYVSWGVLLFAVFVLLSNANAIRAILFGLPTQTRLADAQFVLEAARAAVEQNRAINRTLPERVPLAALDALVRMERTADGSYVLVIDANGVRARMNAAGVMAVENQ